MAARNTTSGALTAVSNGVTYTAGRGYGDGRFNLSVFGTFVGTVRVERSFDSGVTWLPCTNAGTVVTFTAPFTEVLIEPEDAVQYRLACTAYTSGTINYRFSQ